jgi:hypothetical protein
LIGVISNNRFWASKSTFMNDPREIAYAWEIYKKELATRQQMDQDVGKVLLRKIELMFELQDMFMLSFSRSLDDLSLWNRYNDARGYCLHLDARDLHERIVGEEAKQWLQGFHPAIYGRDEQEEWARRLLSAYLDEQSRALLPDLMHSPESAEWKNQILDSLFAFKSEAYRVENELRAMFHVPNLKSYLRDTYWKGAVKFRPRDGYVLPYIEVPLSSHHWLKAVMLGPRLTDPRAKEGLQILLASKGIDVPVLDSQCPFR